MVVEGIVLLINTEKGIITQFKLFKLTFSQKSRMHDTIFCYANCARKTRRLDLTVELRKGMESVQSSIVKH